LPLKLPVCSAVCREDQGVGEDGDGDDHPGVPHHQAQPVGERPALVLLPQALAGHHQGDAEAWGAVGGWL
jgi:hypothetical protein